MAGIQGISNVHRQATFETNRLKLQRGSLDLPVIDSGEVDEKLIYSPKENKAYNSKTIGSDSKPLNKNEPNEARAKGQTDKTHDNKSLIVPNSQKGTAGVPEKQEHNKGGDSKARSQLPKPPHQSNNPPSPVQNKQKGFGSSADKKEHTKKSETKEKGQLKSDQASKPIASVQNTHKGDGITIDKKEPAQKVEPKDKTQQKTGQTTKHSPPHNTNTIKGEEIDKGNTVVDSKKGHKKESVLSKLNANKLAKTEAPIKEDQPASTKTLQNAKSQNKHPESGVSKITANPKASQSTSDSTKPSPRKGDTNELSNPQKSKGNVEVSNTSKSSPTAKKGNVIFNIDQKKQGEKKPENLPSVNIKTGNGNKPDDKQNKGSEQNSVNSKTDKTPPRKSFPQQGSKSSEPTTTKLSPKGEHTLKTIDTNKSNKQESVSLDIKPPGAAKEKKVDIPVTNAQIKHSENLKERTGKDLPTIQSKDSVIKKPLPNKLNRTGPQDSVKSNNNSIQAENVEQSDPKSNGNSPRSDRSNANEHKSVESVTQSGLKELPVNKAPVGTILTSHDQQKTNSSHERELESNDKTHAGDIGVKQADHSQIPQNPLIEGITIEERDTKMDGRRRESYEALYAERNTLLKAEKAYKARIKQLEDEANGFLKVIEDLTAENRSLRKKIDMLEDELNADGKTNLVGKLEDMEEENRTLKTLMKGQKEVIAELKHADSGGDQQQNETRELKLHIVKLQTENQTQNEENVKLKADYYATVKQLNSLIAENKSDKSTKEVVSDDKTRRMIKTLQNESAEHKKQINALEYENNALSESLAQKKNELKEILGVMKDENKFDNELKDLRNEVIKLKKEKRELELEHGKQKRDLHVELQEKSSLLSDKTTQYDELKIKADELETENGKTKLDIESLNKDKRSLQEELDSLKAEMERLKLELQQIKDMHNKVLSQSESASNDFKSTKIELEQFNRDLQTIVADKESQISKLISQLDTLRQDKESEKKAFVEEKGALLNEAGRLKVFEEHYLKKEKDLQACQGKLEETELKRKQLAMNLEDKGFEVSNLQQQIFELNMKLDGNTKRMHQLDKDKRELELDKREWEIKKDKVNDIESSNKRLLEENKRLRNQIEITTLATDPKPSETSSEVVTSPAEAWVQERANQQAMYVKRERNKKKVHIMAEHSVPKKRQPFTRSSPVRSTKPQSKREVIKVGLNSSRSLEDIRRTPDRKSSPDSQPSLPEVNKDTRLTFGGSVYGGYSEIHRNRLRAANKRVY